MFEAGSLSQLKSPIFVGHATNLRTRFKNHSLGGIKNNIRSKVRNIENKLSFHYAVFEGFSKDKLMVLEQELIDCFGPTLNKVNVISKQTEQKGSLIGEIVGGN